MKHSKTSSCMSYTKRDDNLLVGGCMKMKHSKTNSCTSYTKRDDNLSDHCCSCSSKE